MNHQTATICIFEDKEFSEEVNFPEQVGFNALRMRCELGWQFELHQKWCPEAEMRNRDRRKIVQPDDFREALAYVRSVSGYACLLFDLTLEIRENGLPINPLSEGQSDDVSKIANDEVVASSYPGLFLALEASRNCAWQGVVAIASTKGDTLAYQTVRNTLQGMFPQKEFVLLNFGITSSLVTPANRQAMLAKCIEAFLKLVGASKPAKERLHISGKADGWFAYLNHSELPHRFDKLVECQGAKDILRDYLMKVLRCRESESDELINSDLGQNLYDELKTLVGACAKVYSDKGDKNLSLYALMICAGACCPQPLPWLKSVKHVRNAEVFAPDVSPVVAQSVFDLLVGEQGLFLKLFVWDTGRAPKRNIRESVIIEVNLTSHKLEFSLHEDFSVAKLADDKRKPGDTRKRWDQLDEFLKGQRHPLAIGFQAEKNSITFEIAQRTL